MRDPDASPSFQRVPTRRYRDPLDRVWLDCAGRLGFRVERSSATYASTDGRRTITIGTDDTLDPDDSLAQMLLHEICHALVEGPDAIERRDWGLDNETTRDVPREHACLRLQAALAAPHGLRKVLAPTTDFRAFYDALPADPLWPADEDTVKWAKAGAARAAQPPWAPPLHEALEATAAIARAVAPFAEGARDEGLDSLWAFVEPPVPRHPLGFFTALPGSEAASATCGACAWRAVGGPGRPVARCRQADGARVFDQWPACERFERALDCRACAACCREGYDLVLVSPRDPVARKHPHLVRHQGRLLEIRRDGPRCAALAGGHGRGEPYACAIYDDRPRCCRELEAGGEHCLVARRRVGLSR